MTFTLHNPLTEEEWDIIEDVDFDHTNSITFHTKHGKDVEFVKRKTGEWIAISKATPMASGFGIRISYLYKCDMCGHMSKARTPFCPNCGAKME